MAPKELPIGIQDFPTLIEGNYIYVDKTEYYHRLVTKGTYYFLSRPRRFGKSLLISTLKTIFEGKRDLFQGLWIHDKIDWEPRPVIHLDFSEIVSRETPFVETLSSEMDRIAILNGLPITDGNYDKKFRTLIEQMGAKQKVAILVDEYDKPIINFLENAEKAKENRDIMKNFYAVIKGKDQYISFFMLTGVSKFSQDSIFSDLNNLTDITLTPSFSQMLGYTQAEILQYFPTQLENLEIQWRDTFPNVMAEMKAWYNGYSWDGETYVYNPFSILNLFFNNRFGGYWFATGTPTFLMKLIKQARHTVFDLENLERSLSIFNTFDLPDIEISSILFQTGYLTIKKMDYVSQTVTLDFPNREVSQAFSYHLLAEFADKSRENTDSIVRKMNGYLRQGQVDGFIGAIQTLFVEIAYPIHPAKGSSIANMEKYYHSMFYLALRLLGYNIEAEVTVHTGRIDAVITTEEYIYVVEFKLGDAASAMAQIKSKGYQLKYLGAGKKVILVGIGFDTETRNVGEYLVEEIAG
jgi:hypothetical protein